ncbi:MAG: hypothetical protein JSV65_19340 [Armatimonadota bacterium]|nr:MAG: hypothetical protein JSV65_19340 [Armatimonadota bacterium]
MRSQFVDEPIEVELAEDKPGRPPVAVTWRDDEYGVEHIEAVWHDASWGPLQARPKRWWQRRHRTYYQVKVSGGRIFELYHDRGVRQWILYRILYLEPEA